MLQTLEDTSCVKEALTSSFLKNGLSNRATVGSASDCTIVGSASDYSVLCVCFDTYYIKVEMVASAL